MPEASKEIAYPRELKQGSIDMHGAKDVRRLQEWLGFHGFGTDIDGDYGAATQASLDAFRRARHIEATDGLDEISWASLVDPLLKATSFRSTKTSLGDVIVETADAHLKQKPREIGGDNRGPWVRLYCKGLDGEQFPWCQGFASSIWEQGARSLGVETPYPLYDGQTFSLYVPWVVGRSQAHNRFVRGGPGAASRVPVGSMFFVRSGPSYSHVGIVTGITSEETFYTIEGNTNDDGSANGYKVAARSRRFATCDFGVL